MSSAATARPARPVYPFVAIVGQEEMRRTLILTAIDPAIGGVMIMGHRGTGKSTAVRALAEVMPPLIAVEGCPFHCAPGTTVGLCEYCTNEGSARTVEMQVPVVDLPLGATEDRVAGTLDIEQALAHGRRRFEPGVLARANRGFLYIDEVNLLEDHLIDLLLDVAASGVNTVEREGISVRHPAHFSLIGSGNPEEGELRPQLLDRFGLGATIETEREPALRVEIIRRRLAFDADPSGFVAHWAADTATLRNRIGAAQRYLPEVVVPEPALSTIAALTSTLALDGHRGDLTLARAARAHAAFEHRPTVTIEDLRSVAPLALRHRLRTDPFTLDTPSDTVETTFDRIVPG